MGLGLGLDSLSCSSSHALPFFSPPSFHTLSVSLRSLVCGGQPSPHKPRIVVSHSTCPPLSSSPHAHSFVLGDAVINTHGSPTLKKLVEMLVEGVFLVSGVVKTLFSLIKKKKFFSPRTKGSKAGLRGNFQIASFPYGNAKNMFYNFVVLFFSP